MDGNDVFVSVVLTGFCFSSSSISNADINTKYIPEPSGDYAAWELQLISIAANGFRSYYFVPCGTKPAPSPAPNEDSVYYDPLSSAIDVAIANGSNETIEWSAGDSLPKEIVEKVINNPGITIHFTYTYEGVEYDLYLNSENLSKIYKDGIPWFGPLCLAACNGQYTGNGYVVKEGDTLSQIAAMMNTTIEAIMARNPEITDPNVIYIGQVIK